MLFRIVSLKLFTNCYTNFTSKRHNIVNALDYDVQGLRSPSYLLTSVLIKLFVLSLLLLPALSRETFDLYCMLAASNLGYEYYSFYFIGLREVKTLYLNIETVLKMAERAVRCGYLRVSVEGEIHIAYSRNRLLAITY